ncbi:C-type lectin domain family 2 member B isoform X2 [Scleropages formosus]|uniref:C-type lectin domain family 2 member B isoform X2 n=1 Tax=Scleropages formosus TaxID=113540 RepID=UPI000878DC57|nr:C-type lectin domain family 2 member B isoform X2 [Scleropages formosus]
MNIKFCQIYRNGEENGKQPEKPHLAAAAEQEELYRRVRVYRALSLILLLLTLIFAAVVIALCLQLQARPACLKTEHDDGAAQHLCTLELCNQLHPRVEKAVVTSTEKKDSECQALCSNGWLKFGDSCFFLSKLRNSWSGGRQQCQKWGADLAVIDNMQVQEFLTKKGNLMYWIGLNRSSGGQWMWVNQSALGQSYWGPHSDKDSCGFLIGKDMPTKSWGSSDCSYLSAYICQKKI